LLAHRCIFCVMDISFFKKNRTLLICVGGIVLVGGCYFVYQSSMKQSAARVAAERKVAEAMGTDFTHEEWQQFLKEKREKLEQDPDSYNPLDAQYIDQRKREQYHVDGAKTKFPVQVFVRLRPLIKEEIEAKDACIEYQSKHDAKTEKSSLNIVDKSKAERQSIIPSKKKKKKNQDDRRTYKKYGNFRGVVEANDDNERCFQQCIVPSIEGIFEGHTVCSFAYGHTGSGKTYTILGYDEKQCPGMYRLTAQYICDRLKQLNQAMTKNGDAIFLCCRFSELYQGKMRDLFGGLVECHVREDANGNINIRGPTIKEDDSGKVRVQPLSTLLIDGDGIQQLIDKVQESLKLRKTGSSAVHDESSRSHVFLEMELVSERLVEARNKLIAADANIVPWGYKRDNLMIEIQYGQYTQGADGQWTMNPNYQPPKDKEEQLHVVQQKVDVLEAEFAQCQKDIDQIMQSSHACIGGKVVFVDLAGNEWAKESKSIRGDAKAQMDERKEINKSLLSLKECVRALHDRKEFVPYRNSKLTMVLRPYLKGIHSTAIMIANISSSQAQVAKAYNTLSYAQMVAKA